jgi:DNA primase
MSGFTPTHQQVAEWMRINFPDAKTRRGGQEFVINNPFNGDTGRHFNVSVRGVHDWRGDEWAGGKSRTFIRFVQLYRNCSFVEAVKEVCGKDVSIDAIYAKLAARKSDDEPTGTQYDISLPEGSELLIDHKDSLNGRMLISWLNSRGLSEDLIAQYKLYYHSMNVVWPYYEYDSLVYWQERNRLNKSFRFPSNSNKGLFLYGFDMVEPSDYIAVTEAIFDSLTLGEQCVASGGAILTSAQVRKIRALNPVNGIILAPDNDDAGIKSVASNYKLLRPYFNRIYVSIPPAIEHKDGVTKDWNNLICEIKMPRDEVRKTFENSIRLLSQTDVVQLMVSQ